MALTCYNKGCGQKFDADKNNDDSCLFHAGVPIFHDALKGWSCCKKRTTDFSEFLSIQGCTRGRHSNEKPHEPLLPEVSSDKGRIKHTNNGQEIIYQGPKSAEKLQKERPSSDEPMTKLPHKVSASLAKELEKLDITKKAKDKENESQTVMAGTRCKNAGCKTVYQSPETDLEICTHHPGGPVFHEGYKYWSCCCIKTIDFNAFLDQKGCTAGKHHWVPKQDKKKVACRFDWHQTGKNVVVTIYAKNTNPEISFVEANRTVLSCQLQFENDKIFKKEFHLWGVIDVKQSSINMVPSKVEIYLRKADPVSWGKLEDPNYKPPPEPADDPFQESVNDFYNNPDYDIDDDDISESDEEWGNEMAPQKTEEQEAQKKKEEAITAFHTKELEEEMKRVSEQQKKEEEDRKRKEELRKQDEEEGFDEMPDLE